MEELRFQLDAFSRHPEAWSGGQSAGPLASGLWPLASISLRSLDRWAFRAVISAVPAMTIVKDLVLAGFPFELNEEDRLDLGSFTGGRPCVDRLNGHALGKKVELGHQK